jgi:hypothetical protein
MLPLEVLFITGYLIEVDASEIQEDCTQQFKPLALAPALSKCTSHINGTPSGQGLTATYFSGAVFGSQ